jgi:hypothetical protein
MGLSRGNLVLRQGKSHGMGSAKGGAMTTSIVKVKRSTVYHLLNTIAPTNHKLKAELDILGAILIVILALGIVTFARLILFSGQ